MKLNDHVASVACQTCHIPEIARGGVATEIDWDWRTAGKTKDAMSDGDKAACHSDFVGNETEAFQVQGEKLLQLRRKGNEGAPPV